MSQWPAMDNLFSNDPFFSQERLLWPLDQEALSSLQQDFFHRRTKLAEGLLKELHDGPHLLDLHQGAFPRSLFSSLPDSVCSQPGGRRRRTPAGVRCLGGNHPRRGQPAGPRSLGPHRHHPRGGEKDLLVTLDMRGYAPEDIHVKLEGRRLAVVAMKRAAAEASQDSSSASCCSSQRSATSSQAGFVQNIDLPPHLDLSALSCTLTEDGRLRVDAPVARRSIKDSGEAEQQQEQMQQEQEKQQEQQQQQQMQQEQQQQQMQQEQPQEQEEEPVKFRSSLEFPVSKDN
ncbi:hypothetical protein NHX12_031404 [Muraenolepis orangiensis]|uniref:SHSP domain-containing protein n=1 Tax=Muraenolepis orangiensis TaxID=630683 RepID=A0A9Q0E6Z3_9TELE|nr:hypothetical protein NHX12_031404 [Muraenolepis orangiensis]